MDEHAEHENGEPLSKWDRFWWYAIGGLAGAPIAVVLAEMTGTGWTGLYVVWAAWVPFLWVLTYLGFWSLLGRAILTIFRPLAKFLRPLVKVFGAIEKVFEVIFAVIFRVVSGLFSALGALLVIAIILFVFAGAIGLLWFGIRQLF